MNSKDEEVFTGTTQSVISQFATVTGDRNATLAALAMARWAPTWERLYLDWRGLLQERAAGQNAMKRRILSVLQILSQQTFCSPELRFEYMIPCMPEVTLLLDTFPVNCRGPSSQFNGKYKGKVRKYQSVTDLCGNLMSVLRAKTDTTTDRSFDSTVFAKVGAGVELIPGEVILGDKAYVACNKVVTPPKMRRNGRLSDAEVNFSKVCQLTRSPIERSFARHHRFRVIKYCPYRESTGDMLVKLVCLIDSMHMEMPSRWLEKRYEPLARDTNITANDVVAATLPNLTDMDHSDLNGLNSAKRRKDSAETKPWRREYETKCTKCKQGKSVCACSALRRQAPRHSPPVSSESDSVHSEASSGSDINDV
eukprot:PhM_4_TR18088/c0_g1_i4/m.106223